MNDSKNGEIIQPSQNFMIEIKVKNATLTPKIQLYEVKPSCPFEKCHLSDMKGKKWASIEDAGILLCTKAPQDVDCLKYNTEYRKLMKHKRDLQYDGINVQL